MPLTLGETKGCCFVAYEGVKGESYQFPDGETWSVTQHWATRITGFKAALISSDDKTVLAFAGTDSIMDVAVDVVQVLGGSPTPIFSGNGARGSGGSKDHGRTAAPRRAYVAVTSSRGGSTPAAFPGGVTGSFNIANTSKIDWFGPVRGRIGFVPTERLLIYATGLAYGEAKTHIANSSAFSTGLSRLWLGDNSDVRVGWTAGGGLEYAFTNNWTLRGEYLYVDLGSSGTTPTFQGTDPLQSQIRYNASRENRFSVARAALSYKF